MSTETEILTSYRAEVTRLHERITELEAEIVRLREICERAGLET
jgi:uncharacterized small protein (DUF1192 family)